MAKYKSIVTTEVGLALLEDSAYMGHAIQFTALKTGNGIYNGTEELAAATDLKNVCQTFGVGSVSKKDSDIVVRTAMNNSNVTDGYTITELGLYAMNPDTNTEILYAIVIAETGSEDYFPPHTEAPTSITLEMYIGLTEAAEAVTFNVLPVEGVYVPVESFNEVLAGTTPVGDSNKLGGKGASDWQSSIDDIQTTKNTIFTNAGWYRVAKISGSDENYCKLAIVKQWASNGSETHVIEYIQTYTNRVLKSTFDSVSNGQSIKKARVTTEGTDRYIEIYYDSGATIKNWMVWSVSDNVSLDTANRWYAIDAVQTSETVSGVTVEVTYDIPANASPFTTVGGTIDGNLEVIGNKIALKNSAKAVGMRVYENGTAEFYDYTNAKNIFRNTADGTNTFNGIATGNLPLSGGAINGGMRIETADSAPFALKNTSTSGGRILIDFYSAGVQQGLLGFNGKDNPTFRTTGGANNTLLHSGNVGSYALPVNGGGTVDGWLEVKGGYQGPLSINSTTDDILVVLPFMKKGVMQGALGMLDKNNPIFLDVDGNGKTLLHTGNKPTGSYIGNGDATQRVINLGAIGNVCVVYNTDTTLGLVFVTSKGCYLLDGSRYEDMSFLNGNLYIMSARDNVNKSGTTYYYQVL